MFKNEMKFTHNQNKSVSLNKMQKCLFMSASKIYTKNLI